MYRNVYRNVCQKSSTRTVYIVYVLSQHFPNTFPTVLCPIRSSQQAPVKWMALGFPCCVHELGPPRWRWSSAVQAGSPAVPGSAYRTKVAKEQTKEQVTWHLTWTKMPGPVFEIISAFHQAGWLELNICEAAGSFSLLECQLQGHWKVPASAHV